MSLRDRAFDNRGMSTPSEPRGGVIARTWRRLRSPSARWSVLALLVLGILVGFVATAGTQVMVYLTGTDEFCGTACHSMTWVAAEHKKSPHQTNRTGVGAGCHDCHIPPHYPENLIYKTKAGIKDMIGEMRGIISTEEKFKKKRAELAQHVWDEFKENDSRACRGCHKFTPAVIAKQNEALKDFHTAAMERKATCIDCHKGVAHATPE
jgi:nitrate/TMAO reductase-like tetraheme cytochrome c subunit